MAKLYLKTIAIFLLLAILAFGAPSLGFAGGCDEPGYTGGSCNKAESQPTSGDDPSSGSGGLGDEPGDNSTGGGSSGQILPGTGSEPSTAEWTFVQDLTRVVLSWLTIASGP